MAVYYEYDYAFDDVLIRIENDSRPEILHKGDRHWEYLDGKDDMYFRAIFLGQGCWEDLIKVSEAEAEKFLKRWGYTENPPSAK